MQFWCQTDRVELMCAQKLCVVSKANHVHSGVWWRLWYKIKLIASKSERVQRKEYTFKSSDFSDATWKRERQSDTQILSLMVVWRFTRIENHSQRARLWIAFCAQLLLSFLRLLCQLQFNDSLPMNEKPNLIQLLFLLRLIVESERKRLVCERKIIFDVRLKS